MRKSKPLTDEQSQLVKIAQKYHARAAQLELQAARTRDERDYTIKLMLDTGLSVYRIAKELDVTEPAIAKIKKAIDAKRIKRVDSSMTIAGVAVSQRTWHNSFERILADQRRRDRELAEEHERKDVPFMQASAEWKREQERKATELERLQY
jgi:transposase